MKRKKPWWAVGFTIALTAFTLYAVLDTFVIPKVYNSNTAKVNTSMFESDNSLKEESGTLAQPGDAQSAQEDEAQSETESSESAQVQQTSDSYSDGNVSVKLTERYENNTKIYVADITVSSVQSLKTAFANGQFGRNMTDTTSSIAEQNNAVIAVNGDFCGARESGYVIRNGVVYRDTASGDDLLCIYADGTMSVVDQSQVSADQLVSDGVWQAFCFGPGLVEDGQITVGENDEVGRAMASNPRTAIGMIDANHYVMVVSDGRTSESEGLSLYELAQFMQGLGVKTAYNLDGGGSSTMYFNGQVVNNPTSGGNRTKERGVSDIVYI